MKCLFLAGQVIHLKTLLVIRYSYNVIELGSKQE